MLEQAARRVLLDVFKEPRSGAAARALAALEAALAISDEASLQQRQSI